LVAVAISEWRAREAKRVTTYDSARWAETREVRDAWLLGHDGVLLGRWRDEYLRHDGPEHVLCFAPTRSGKGVGLVVPTLLTWPGSAIVHDIKGENLTLTAGGHARFGHGLPFDPTHAQSAAYNPLLKVRCGEWEVRDVQNIADVLVDPEGALEKRNHWEKTSHSPLGGTILHVLYAEPDKTLAGFANSLSDPKRSIETTLRAMMTTPHLNSIGGWADFGVGYAALAAAVVGVWVAAPSLFLAGFLLISALHFSGDPDPRTGGFSRLIYGGAIIVVPALLHRLAP
jgi:type IV secretion system protein VirD4